MDEETDGHGSEPRDEQGGPYHLVPVRRRPDMVRFLVAGAFLGVVNTVMTEAVMTVSPVDRPIASAAYSFVRFSGGAVAPWLAGKLSEGLSADTPFYVGAAAVAAGLAVLLTGRRHLAATEAPREVRVAVALSPAAPGMVVVEGGRAAA